MAIFAAMLKRKNPWLIAFRLRTLPLAFAAIFLGTALAVFNGYFNAWVFVFALLTAFALQVLSNLANDYGDNKKGTDNVYRIGPARAMQSGILSEKQMMDGIVAFGAIAFLCGSTLLFFISGLNLPIMLIFLCIGFASIYAALKYTVGDNPYGYNGFGDIFVFIFFGIVAVAGTAFLHQHKTIAGNLLPATAFGLLSVAVLNVNNMRDILNDKKSNKITIPVKLGIKKARIYHALLVVGAFFIYTTYTLLEFKYWSQFLYLATLPLIVFHLYKIFTIKTYNEFDPLLKQLAILSTITTLIFGLGLIWVAFN